MLTHATLITASTSLRMIDYHRMGRVQGHDVTSLKFDEYLGNGSRQRHRYNQMVLCESMNPLAHFAKNNSALSFNVCVDML